MQRDVDDRFTIRHHNGKQIYENEHITGTTKQKTLRDSHVAGATSTPTRLPEEQHEGVRKCSEIVVAVYMLYRI